ncbi:protein phosphatase 2C domain-containing protein [Streptomyces sp. MST-110588]|uniref:protein phosphatase 2C domain-containing protein n=1 Tax=Streptomyces sp. MST-110588 TaxID=2833628 RepID=UPI001F5C80C4|nr:protein phosphatase 2C domain-containing protein [Streptomyces sp. MST-110588]UNO39954.1 protein phosphatase 2C domain-containing protein [Streptomyces sp. MST-110588]
MRIELSSEPGDPQRPNEDYASVALPASGQGGVLVLLDGVTPPPGDDGCVHGVPWFTARLGGAMLELSASLLDMTLPEVLSAAITRTAEAHRSTCDLSHARTPQATVVAARWSQETVEHLVLSDSALLVGCPDGSVRPVLDTRLDELPPEVRALRATVRALPHGSPERAGAAAEYGRAVEALRNAEGGFHTAAADPSVAARAVTGTMPRAEVTSLAALTDGATRWVEVFREGSWADCLTLLAKQGPRALVEQVRTAEAADPEGRAFPRGKSQDDATAVFVSL